MAATVVCTICARSGSKAVADKNIRIIAGKPLLAHSIDQAREAGLFEHIAFSSDNQNYLEVAREAGSSIQVSRPPELASDSAGKIPAIRHCVAQVEEVIGHQVDIIIDLDCTSPLRFAADIVGSLKLLQQSGTGNVISGSRARRSPYFNLVERKADSRIDLVKVPDKQLLRRQDAPQCYDMNASIYVWYRSALMEREGLFHEDTDIFVMPEERSIDIDSELDFDIVSMLLERRIRGE